MIAIFFLLSSAAGALVTPDPYTVTPLNSSGILLENMGELWIYHDTWSVITEIDLSELEEQTKLAEHAEHLMIQLCSHNITKTTTCPMQQRHIHAIIDDIKRRTKIIYELNVKSRQQRSVFDGIGSAMHYLFGTMDHNNENEIYSKIGELKANEKTLIELEKQQISVVNTTLIQMQKPLAVLLDRQRQIGYQISDLQNATEKIDQVQARQEIVSSILIQVIEINQRQQSLLDIVIAAKHNQIHPLLISPDTLSTIYQKTKSICQNCLPMLEQTSKTQSYQLRNKLIVKISLPILNQPPLQYYKIWCYPIPSKTGHSVVPEITYPYIAIQIPTQTYALFKRKDTQNFIKITRTVNEDTYIGTLNVPMTRVTSASKCVVRMLHNPLNEETQCPLKIQISSQDLIIKMNRPNTWLFSLQNPQTLQIKCPGQIITTQLRHQGILTVNRPCQIHLKDQIIHYQKPAGKPLKVVQPPYFPLTDPNVADLNLTSIKWHSSVKAYNQTKLLMEYETNEIIHQGTLSLKEIQEKVEEINRNESQTNPTILPVTSLSISSLIILGIIVYITLKLTPALVARCSSKKEPKTDAEIESHQIPLAEHPTGTNALEDRVPRPQSRSLRLPKTASLQLVG